MWVKIKLPGYGPQVLVHVATYQGKPFWVPIFDPQPVDTASQMCKSAKAPPPKNDVHLQAPKIPLVMLICVHLRHPHAT